MAAARRRWLQCNIPMFLDFIVLVYIVLSYAAFQANMKITLFLSAMTLWSLHMAALSHPGPIRPWEYDPAIFGSESGDLEQGANICKSCDQPKPPRAHHCRQCDECIARYDHHCDWIDNCIGAANNKCFFLFLFYILLCIVHYLVCLVVTVVAAASFVNSMLMLGRLGVFVTIGIMIYTFLVIPCGILAAVFIATSIYQICRNETTFEQNYDKLAHRRYGRGVLSNVKEVLGPNPLLWLVPTLVEGTAPRIFAARGSSQV